MTFREKQQICTFGVRNFSLAGCITRPRQL
jgi:hypothetical protein